MVKQVDMQKQADMARILNQRALQFLGVILWKFRDQYPNMTIEITTVEMQDFNLAFCHVEGGTAVSIDAREDKIVLSLTKRDGTPLPPKG